MSSVLPNGLQEIQPSLTNAVVLLGPALELDLDGGVIMNGQQEILLTAQEIAVLHLLVATMRHGRGYLSAQAIAQRINLVHANNPEHCIEQTISQLRRKLGEKLRDSRILRGRRGLGYRLFPMQS